MSAVEDYQAATEQLATATAQETLAIYAELTAERLPPGTAVLWIAAAINRANAAAVGLADVWLSVQIEELTGEPTPTVGVLPVDSSDRLIKAVDTVLSGKPAQSVENAGQKRAGVPDVPATEVDAEADIDHDKPTNTPEMRLERLARSEPLEASQRATHEAIQRQPGVTGWVRQMEPDACQLCRFIWREGRIWPKAHPFQVMHPGCNCQPRIVVAQHIQSTAYTRALRN